MKKAVLFDLDGVVVDTERTVWHESSVVLLNMYNKQFDVHQVDHLLFGAKFEDATRILFDFYAIDDTFENFFENRRKLVTKGFAENVTFMEGFETFFSTLSDRKKAIATSMPHEFLKLTMGHLPLRKYFGDHIYTIAESGGRGKPHPDIFLYAAKKVGADPSACIVIEDAAKGIEAAKKAGMKAIALTTSMAPEHLQKADFLVQSFAEITPEMLA